MPVENTTQITLTLPKNVLEIVRARVGAGQYPTESAAIEAAIIESLLSPPSDDELSGEYLRREVLPVLDAMNAHPARGLTLDQVRESLAQRHKNFRKAC